MMLEKNLMVLAGSLVLLVAMPDSVEARTQQTTAPGFSFCNKTPHGLIQVAVAYKISGKGQWASEGWYRVKRGRCVKIIKWSLAAKKHLYWFAQTPTRSSAWTGRHAFCVKTKQFYHKGRHARCDPRPLRKARFRLLKVKKRSGIKLTLTR